MSATLEFYRARAAECEREAAEAVLENVRERCLRAASAWHVMANKMDIAETMRETAAREKAEASAI